MDKRPFFGQMAEKGPKVVQSLACITQKTVSLQSNSKNLLRSIGYLKDSSCNDQVQHLMYQVPDTTSEHVRIRGHDNYNK